MNKSLKTHRIIATFFLLIFFPTLIPVNLLYGSNNGPKSPEAASFEPVDATDMVNLVTGQYSYVLPLLNVPSPEGGYPIALSYHAGIALDQQSSWTGLGWNLNPGSINRNINGYPDDYNASQLNEFFYDQGGVATTNSLSLGYTNGAISVGLGFNWGSHQSLGGQISIGYGFNIEGVGGVGANISMGTNGTSVGLGANFTGGLSVGINASESSGMSGIIGFNSNGTGFAISSSGDVSIDMGIGNGNSISFNGTSNGIGVSLKSSVKGVTGRAGVGLNISFNNTFSMGDYTTNQSSWSIPIVVPTPIGIFSLTFGQQKFKYWLGKNTNNFVTGPIYYEKGVTNVYKEIYKCVYVGGQVAPGIECGWTTVFVGKAFMDINEVSISSNTFSSNTAVTDNNLVYPNYDDYTVQAQGLSGNIKSTLFENGALFGLDSKENSKGYIIKYDVNGSSSYLDNKLKFNNKPHFYFENEISTYLDYTDVNELHFNTSSNYDNIFLYANQSNIESFGKNRRKTSNFIEYYNNEELTNLTTLNSIKSNGYLEPQSLLDRNNLPKDGIGAFKITAIDGKTYHYSLPVYNHEVITRTFGVIENNLDESQSYFEKRQLEPYATHWLLTAITGPDFIDNGDGIAGDGDLGYWVSFEYGKWSDGFVWKAPFDKDFIIDDENPNIKTSIRGRKQLYYLDKIKTRTHSAIFVKSPRNDSNSPTWNYFSVEHKNSLNQNSNNFVSKFIIPSQSQLKLDKIILYKNENEVINKNNNQTNPITHFRYNNSEKEEEVAEFHCRKNVIDNNDNWEHQMQNAIKVIDLNYEMVNKYNKSALNLKSVHFKGKNNAKVLPPYEFQYYNNSSTLNSNKFDDGWGYNAISPQSHSLKEIRTPIGAKINILYESNMSKSIMPHKLEFSNLNKDKFTSTMPFYSDPNDVTNKTVVIDVGNSNVYPIGVGKQVNINLIRNKVCFNQLFYYAKYNGTGHITENLGNGKYKVLFDNNVVWGTDPDHPSVPSGQHGCNMSAVTSNINNFGLEYFYHDIRVSIDFGINDVFISGGPRVKSLTIGEVSNIQKIEYAYGENENGLGYLSYLPYSQNIAKEIPYSAELPAPRVMYDYVSVLAKNSSGEFLSKIRYKFNVITKKTLNQLKYDDFYEIIISRSEHINNNSNKRVDLGSFIVKDNLASIGQLLEITSFNSNNHILGKLKNKYYKPNELPNNIGLKKESYQSYKTIDYVNNTSSLLDKWIINSTTRLTYPSVIESSSEETKGYVSTTQFNDYDLVSGISKELVFTSSNGNIFKTKVVPAYTKYPQMGSKVDNINNRNMLSQTAANYTYIEEGGQWKITSVGITTWNNEWGYQDMNGVSTSPSLDKEKIWRKHKSYTWNGDKDSNGIFLNYNNGNDDNFVWGIGQPQTNSKWKQISEVTLYNNYSMPLEFMDINGNKAATKMDVFNQKIQSTGNAGYNEMYYSSGEELLYNFYVGHEIRIQDATRTSDYSHTGKFSIRTTNSSQFGVFMHVGHRPGKYKISAWVHKNNYQKARLRWFNNNIENTFEFNGEKYFAGDWVLLTHYTPEHYMNNSAAYWYVNSIDNSYVYFDDLMIRPISSSMKGYVYNEYDELTYVVGDNGLATKFEYDAGGRLVKTYIEIIDDAENNIIGGFKLASENKIKYKNL